MKQLPGLIVALVALLLAGGLFFNLASHHLEPSRARAFALDSAKQLDIKDGSPIVSDYGSGHFRFLFSTGGETYCDMEVERVGGEWTVMHLDPEFRPWQGVKDSR